MSRVPVLTDSLLREALAPDPDALLPAGLLASIGDAIRATPQERAPIRVPGLDGLAARTGLQAPAWLAANRGLVLIAATIALLLALLGGALLGVGRQGFERTPLRSTGLVRISSEWLPVDRVLPGGDGDLWAISSGQVTRFDPATGERHSWTAADDAAFSQPLVAPSAAGGVWVLADGWARRFDGAGFVEAVPVEAANPMELVPASDGTLWLASWDLGLQRWDGRRWATAPGGRPTDAVDVPLLVLGPEDVWVENPGPGQRGEEGPYSLGVSHLVGGAWITYDARDAPQLAGPIGAIEQAADGSIWVTQDPGVGGAGGIARFDGSTWTTVDGPPTPAWWLEADPDGSMWAITSAADGSATVAHRANGTWQEFGPADGIASRSLGPVSVTPAGVYLGTSAGLVRFADGRWDPVWPADAAARGPDLTMPDLTEVIAVSAGEAWAADGTDLWHWVGGAWERPLPSLGVAAALGPESPLVADIALPPDGALWVATDRGVLRVRDGRLEVADEEGARTIAVGPDGTAWAIDAGGTTARHIVPAGTAFTVQRFDCPLSPWAMAVASDGTVYLGDIGYTSVTPGLARLAGERCEMVSLPADIGSAAVTAIVPDPRGGVVVEALATLPGYSGGGLWHGYLLHVDGTGITEIADEGEIEGAMRLRLVDPAGRVWRTPLGSSPELEAFDGTRWVPLLEGIDIGGPISVAPDGAVFLVGLGGIYRWIP